MFSSLSSHPTISCIALVSQVWYSAAWSSATLSVFRASLTKVLLGCGVNVSGGSTALGFQPPAVMEILRHWQCHDVPLSAARSKWLDSLDRAHSTVANFKCVPYCWYSDVILLLSLKFNVSHLILPGGARTGWHSVHTSSQASCSLSMLAA